jgi:hypothetical protein
VPVTAVEGPVNQIVVFDRHGVRVEGLDVAGVSELPVPGRQKEWTSPGRRSSPPAKRKI